MRDSVCVCVCMCVCVCHVNEGGRWCKGIKSSSSTVEKSVVNIED